MLNNEHYLLIKELIKEQNIEKLETILCLAGEVLHQDYLKHISSDFQSLFFQIYIMLFLEIQFFGDSDISPEDLDTLRNKTKELINKLELTKQGQKILKKKGNLVLLPGGLLSE